MEPNTRVKVGALVLSASTLVGLAVNEAYKPVAYIPVPGDVPTIGFGETKGVKMGDKTTPERALVQLLQSAQAHADGVRACVHVPLFQYEFEAYVDFAYNVGVGAFCGSTLAKKLNAGDYDGACYELLKWNRAGGRVLSGLTKRRQAEFEKCEGRA
jgi:lysozyme